MKVAERREIRHTGRWANAQQVAGWLALAAHDLWFFTTLSLDNEHNQAAARAVLSRIEGYLEGTRAWVRRKKEELK